MDAIDALVAARVTKPTGIAAGEAMVWNGSAFVRSTTTNIGPTSLGSGTPDATKFLRGDGAWVVPATTTTYRKTTAKAVNTTTVATDLLNGEITIGAGVMGTSGVVRLTMWGDYLNNSGGNTTTQRFQVVFGGTTILDTNVTGAASLGAGATRWPWKFVVEIMNLGATNAQLVHLLGQSIGQANTGSHIPFTTGEGSINMDGQSLTSWEGHNTSALDTTTAKALAFIVTNPSASASFETKLVGALVEVV